MMTVMVLTSLMVASSISMLSNPLSMGLAILLMALIMSTIFALSMTSWLAFLIFLIYIGGMLVLFSYFVAITPNQTLPSSYVSLMLLSSMLPMYMIIKMNMINSPMFPLSNHKMNILYMTTTASTLMILASILLITMIIVVKMTMNFKGPLRPFK